MKRIACALVRWPSSAHRLMYEPLHKLKYAFFATYFDQTCITLVRLVKEKGAKRVGTLYQDDDFGLEILRGADAGLKALAMEMTEKTTYKRGATDFSSQMARLKAGNCDLVVLGTVIRETVGSMTEARKIGFNPTFMGAVSTYSELIPKLGGKAVDGLYSAMATQIPYIDEASQPIRFWANKYKTKFSEEPTVYSAYGYNIIDTFAKAAHKAGPNLSTDAFIKAMDSMVVPPDIFGSPEASYTATKRLGSDASRLSQLVDGRWKVVSEYIKP